MSWKTKQLKNLAQTLLSLKSQKDMMAFLRDLCTLDELDELSRRWEIAKMLDSGISYRAIAKKTGLSTTTVSRVSHWLHHGEGGYQTALTQRKRKKRR